MTGASSILAGGDAVLDNHYFVRDGSWWICRNRCPVLVPFPSPMPDSATLGPCTPRLWRDSEPDRTVAHALDVASTPAPEKLPNGYQRNAAGRSVLDHPCTDCGASAGQRCADGRRISGEKIRPHFVRRLP